ncbi:MAG: OmpA family protein [Burkholderiaceae bacterium]
MRAIWLLLLRLPLPLLALASCGSPPKPPTVDESQKRPANSAMAVELQTCKSNLQSTRIVATESWRLAEANAANVERMSARQQVIAEIASAQTANTVFTIHFDFGSTRVLVPADTAGTLVDAARSAPLVLLRGRTDGNTNSFSESRVARERAVAMRDYLVAAGVDPKRIRDTYQPVGDHAADNSTASGREMNRRVEIEVYRALPVAMGTSGTAQP